MNSRNKDREEMEDYLKTVPAQAASAIRDQMEGREWQTGGFTVTDMTWQAFGKYMHTTKYGGFWYADCDFAADGKPKHGAIPDPAFHPDARPYRRSLLSRMFSA